MSAAYAGLPSGAEALSKALGGKRVGGGYMARCPAHDDRNPSLSITQRNGRVLFKCQAGCSQDAVIGALKDLGLWSSDVHENAPNIYYNYNDEQSHPLFRTVRTAEKKFWLQRWEAGEWKSGLGPRRVLYHLDELTARASEPVCIAEGEKDVDRLRSLGYLATCNVIGAGKWDDSYTKTLAQRNIIIFFDGDTETNKFVGQRHAATVALSVLQAGCETRIIHLPNGKDVSDFLDLGGTREQLAELIEAAPIVTAEEVNAWRATFEPKQTHTDTNHPFDGWPDPMPFADESVQVLRQDILPGFLGRYTQALTQFTETPAELTVLAALSIISTAAAGKAEVEAEPGYLEPVNVYGCAVLESGNRKTGVINHVLRPVIKYQMRERERLAGVIARAESERKTKLTLVEKLRKKVADGDDSEIQRIADLEANLPVIPHASVLFSSDATAEKLEVLLSENNARMAIISDEGGPFDLMAGRYNATPNLDVFLKGHSRSPIWVERMGRTSIVPNPTTTIFLSPQPSVMAGLKDFMRGRGLLARFIFAMPASPVGNRKLVPAGISLDITNEYDHRVLNILEWQPAETITLTLTADAYKEWKEFQVSVEAQMADGGRLCRLRDWGSKVPGAALRIAGLLHIAMESGLLSALSVEIGQSEMQIALELCAVFTSHAIAVLGMVSEDPALVKAKRVMKWLQVQPKTAVISKRDAFRAHQPHLFESVEQLDAILGILTDHALIRITEKKTAGRSSTVIELNPRLEEGS